ncbi:MAG: pseudouridine synthase [bacterium]
MSMRIHKYLAHAGVASRRHAEEMVADGKVTVNGKVATIGLVIDENSAHVEVNGKPIKLDTNLVYYLLYKPHAVVSTVNDPEGRPTVMDYLPKNTPRLYPVGRLDYNSEGLILLTNDGTLAQELTHPKYEIDKTYRVLVHGLLTQVSLDILRRGIHLADGITAPATVDVVRQEGGNTWLDITIHEGRNHQVRRMFEALHHTVLRLTRTKLGDWDLGDLKPGEFKTITL